LENKWSRNITLLGLGGLGATLCSRVLASLTLYATNAVNVLGPNLATFVQIPPTGVDFPFLIGGVDVTGLGHFPYGFDVEPNEPV
jgi:hypothetical protein